MRSRIGIFGVLLAIAATMGPIGRMGRMGPMEPEAGPRPEPEPEPEAPADSYDPSLSLRSQIGMAETVKEVGALLLRAEKTAGVSAKTLRRCRQAAAARIAEITHPLPY